VTFASEFHLDISFVQSHRIPSSTVHWNQFREITFVPPNPAFPIQTIEVSNFWLIALIRTRISKLWTHAESAQCPSEHFRTDFIRNRLVIVLWDKPERLNQTTPSLEKHWTLAHFRVPKDGEFSLNQSRHVRSFGIRVIIIVCDWKCQFISRAFANTFGADWFLSLGKICSRFPALVESKIPWNCGPSILGRPGSWGKSPPKLRSFNVVSRFSGRTFGHLSQITSRSNGHGIDELSNRVDGGQFVSSIEANSTIVF
jgi:hypothetical protein